MKRAVTKSATAVVVTASMLTLSACASIFAGTSREITVKTEPAAATCNFTRQGMQIGTADQTPDTVKVSRSRHDITVDCEKPGYNNASTIVVSEFEPWVLANLIPLSAIGFAIDFSTGAYMDYPAETFVHLTPAGGISQQSTAPQHATPGQYGPQYVARPGPTTAQADTNLYQQGYGQGLSYADRLAQYGLDMKRINDNADAAIEETRNSCLWGDPLEWIGGQDQATCEARIAQIEAERRRALEQLDQRWSGSYMQ